MARNALGRGLSALIREPEPQQPPRPQPPQQPVAVAAGATAAVAPALSLNESFLQLDIDLIDPSPFQPRSRFREEALEEGRLSAGHGRALLAIIEPKQRLELARKIARGGMTVRQVERFATRSSKAKADSPNASVDPNTKWALEELQRKFGTKIVLHPLRPGRPGQLAFEYYDASDLTRLYDQLMRE